MLTYVAALFIDWLVRGPWKDPLGFGFPQSRDFGEAYILPVLVEGAGPYNFMIDTGSQATVVTHEINTSLGLNPLGQFAGPGNFLQRPRDRRMAVGLMNPVGFG